MWEITWKKLVPDANGYPTETLFDATRETHADAQDLADELELDEGVYDITITDP